MYLITFYFIFIAFGFIFGRLFLFPSAGAFSELFFSLSFSHPFFSYWNL